MFFDIHSSSLVYTFAFQGSIFPLVESELIRFSRASRHRRHSWGSSEPRGRSSPRPVGGPRGGLRPEGTLRRVMYSVRPLAASLWRIVIECWLCVLITAPLIPCHCILSHWILSHCILYHCILCSIAMTHLIVPCHSLANHTIQNWSVKECSACLLTYPSVPVSILSILTWPSDSSCRQSALQQSNPNARLQLPPLSRPLECRCPEGLGGLSGQAGGWVGGWVGGCPCFSNCSIAIGQHQTAPVQTGLH